jgi:hypothetical protein
MLSRTTNIDISILRRKSDKLLAYFDLCSRSIAERMSWASQRQTTRPEDMAYCLFGLFDVHLPPLYGEGAQNAFMRLQQEIIKSTTDTSVLACSVEDRNAATLWYTTYRALALSPAVFAGASDIITSDTDVEPFHLTDTGLRLKVPVFRTENTTEGLEICTAVLLNCRHRREPEVPLGIRLYMFQGNVWRRKADSMCCVEADELARAKVRVVKIYLGLRLLTVCEKSDETKEIMNSASIYKGILVLHTCYHLC